MTQDKWPTLSFICLRMRPSGSPKIMKSLSKHGEEHIITTNLVTIYSCHVFSSQLTTDLFLSYLKQNNQSQSSCSKSVIQFLFTDIYTGEPADFSVTNTHTIGCTYRRGLQFCLQERKWWLHTKINSPFRLEETRLLFFF